MGIIKIISLPLYFAGHEVGNHVRHTYTTRSDADGRDRKEGRWGVIAIIPVVGRSVQRVMATAGVLWWGS